MSSDEDKLIGSGQEHNLVWNYLDGYPPQTHPTQKQKYQIVISIKFVSYVFAMHRKIKPPSIER